NFIGAFRPPGFERRELGQIIEGLAVQHETLTEQAVELELPGELGDCALPTKIAIYRILQEALANGHRHSGATRQRVSVERRGLSPALTVSDDGRGFEPQRVLAREEDVGVEGGHFGLGGIQDRVEMLGGTFTAGESLRPALDAGAEGLAQKTESPKQTLTAIRQVQAGQLVFPQAARRWIEGRAGGGAPGDLTPREREVWALVAGGLTNPQI